MLSAGSRRRRRIGITAVGDAGQNTVSVLTDVHHADSKNQPTQSNDARPLLRIGLFSEHRRPAVPIFNDYNGSTGPLVCPEEVI